MEFVLPQEIYPALVVVMSLIGVDTILGILIHIKNGDFDIRKVPNFLKTEVLPYAGGLVVLGFVAEHVGLYREIFYVVSFSLGSRYLAFIYDKVSKF